MVLDAATRQFIEAARANAGKPREDMTPAEAREATARMRGLTSDGARMARVEELQVPVPDASLPARLFVPEGAPAGLLVYLHGGGWVVGSLFEFDPLCRELAAATGCAVLAVQYRKAPEHPYPTPIDDAWSAFNWLAMRRKEIFGAELPMVVGGDSAGGNLATVVAMRDKADGAPRLSAQVLLYPVTDTDFETASYLDPDKQALLPREAMQTYWSQYLPDESRRQEPEASPLRAQDLTGMPPSIILTAGYDVLCDEGEAYARRLQEAGVSVAHKRFENQVHAFAMMVGLLPGSAAAISFIAEQIDRFLGADSLG